MTESALATQEKTTTDDAVTPEYQRQFEAVQANPVDFTSWVKLLGTCAAQPSFAAVEKSYNGFFAEYPFCYGYWNKYSKEVARFAGQDGAPAPKDVLKRAVQAVPKSVDIWVYYCTAVADLVKAEPDNHERIAEARSVFKQAIQTVGSDPRVNQTGVMLWESFLSFEREHGDAASLGWVYQRLLRASFNRAGNADYLDQWKTWLGSQDEATIADLVKDAGVKSVQDLKDSVQTGHTEALLLWEDRLTYERQIKRYYFHVKPMPERELEAWRKYLSFEETQSLESNTNAALARLVSLYERCVVACAQYPEFWNRYARALEDRRQVDEACAVYERAVANHVNRLPDTHLQYAEYLESVSNVDRARQVLQRLNAIIPGLTQAIVALANLERRCGRLKAAGAVYEAALAQHPEQRTFLAIRYANFQKACHNLGVSRCVLRDAVSADVQSTELLLAWIDFEIDHGTPGEVERLFGVACGEDLSHATPLTGSALDEVWTRRVEFCTDRGESIAILRRLRAKHANFRSEAEAALAITRSKRARETEEKDAEAKRKRESVPEETVTATAAPITTPTPPTATPAIAATGAGAEGYALTYAQQQQQYTHAQQQPQFAQQQQYAHAQYYWMHQQPQYGQQYGAYQHPQ